MHITDPSEHLESCQRIIFNLVNRFNEMYPVDYDTLLSEAYHAYVQACAKYDPTRKGKDGKVAALTSWVYFYVYCDLKTLVMRGASAPQQEDIEDHPVPTQSHFLGSVTEDLSDDARTIISLFLETPGELLGAVGAESAKNVIIRCARELFIRKKMEEEDVDHTPVMTKTVRENRKLLRRAQSKKERELYERFQDASKEITQRLFTRKTTDEWLLENVGLSPKTVRQMCATAY